MSSFFLSFIFHITVINENFLFNIVSHMSHRGTEQGTIERKFYNTWCRNTDDTDQHGLTHWSGDRQMIDHQFAGRCHSVFAMTLYREAPCCLHNEHSV
jgi:hypothetical protein